MKVVFLDFDGVIVTAHTHYHSGDPYCVWWLNDIVKRTGAKVVVSSLWRMGRTVKELQTILDEWGAKEVEVIGRTPLDHNVVRGVEIQRWLDAHPDVEEFVILDDDSDMGELLPKLIKTDAHHGLDQDQADQAVEMLLGALPLQS